MANVDIMNAAQDSHYRYGPKNFTALLLVVTLTQFVFPAKAAFVRVGELAKDFTVTNRATKQPVSLSDFAGKVIFIDLFAYW